MRTLVSLLHRLALIGVAISLAPSMEAEEKRLYAVGVSPYLERQDREMVYKELASLILEKAEGGNRIAIVEALGQKLIVQITIPGGSRFEKNPRARAQHLKTELALLQQFFSTETPHPASMASVVHLPKYLALAARQLRQKEESMIVIVCGSPFYMDEKDDAFNMADVYVPNDELVRMSSRRSVYGTLEKGAALRGVCVHFAYLKECFQHDEHRSAVARMWTLFVQNQEGVLASFAPSPSLAFSRAGQNVRQPIMEAKMDESDRTPAMRKVIHRRETEQETDRVPVPARTKRRETQAMDTTPEPPRPSTEHLPVTPTNRVGMGLVWIAPDAGPRAKDTDVDMYGLPPGGEEISFRRKETAAFNGKYFRDIRRAGSDLKSDDKWAEAWEYMEFDADLDLTRTSVWINLYRGCGSPIYGTFQLAWGGRIVTKSFVFTTPTGNEGRDSANRANSPYWQEIRLAELLSQPQAQASN